MHISIKIGRLIVLKTVLTIQGTDHLIIVCKYAHNKTRLQFCWYQCTLEVSLQSINNLTKNKVEQPVIMGFPICDLFCITSCLLTGALTAVPVVFSSFAIISLRKKDLVHLLNLCGYKCSLSLPCSAFGWSQVCDCGISWSYSLAFLRWWHMGKHQAGNWIKLV